MTACSYPDLIKRSAEQHRELLRALPSTFHSTIVGRLLRSLDAALKNGAATTAPEILFSHADVADVVTLPDTDAKSLLNTHALGLGSPQAPIVVMGTEHAYNLDSAADRVNFALEGCALALLWLTGGTTTIANAIYPSESWTSAEPFTEHPNDFIRVHLDRKRKVGHTWIKLCRIFGRIWDQEPARFLEARTEGVRRLGDVAYQIELSSVPSRRVADGKAASAIRTSFLCEVLEALPKARVLLFSGGDHSNAVHRDIIARSFLRIADHDPVFDMSLDVTSRVPRRPPKRGKKSRPSRQVLWWSATNDKVALRFTPALGGSLSDALVDAIADLVRPFVAP